MFITLTHKENTTEINYFCFRNNEVGNCLRQATDDKDELLVLNLSTAVTLKKICSKQSADAR